MSEFLWFSPKAPPRGHREVPEAGFCVSLFVVLSDAHGRVLAGRYDPDARALEEATGLDEERRRRYAEGWALPARHLRLGEDPALAAREIARTFAGVEPDLRLARVWAESWELPLFPGKTHHDLLFAYEGPLDAAPVDVPPLWRELRLVRADEVTWSRWHDEVLEALLPERARRPPQVER